MLATGFVDVGLPFWYSLQWRVTVPAAILHDEGRSSEPGECNSVNAAVHLQPAAVSQASQ